MIRRAGALLFAWLMMMVQARGAPAQGHGPAYGLSTPTLARGGWSLDVAGMARIGAESGISAMLRPMLSYGVTEDLQVSMSIPVPFVRSSELRPARGATRMPASRDIEALLAWRFHRQGTAIGSRFESTAYAGIDVPTDDVRGEIETAPALFGALVTGYASRSIYAWAGAAYRTERGWFGVREDRRGDVAMYSLVLGYRPQIFRKELPHPDWRVFVEIVGESAGRSVMDGVGQSATGGHELFAGPTLLGLFGAWGVSGGPVFRVHDDVSGTRRTDRARFIINTTFWF